MIEIVTFGLRHRSLKTTYGLERGPDIGATHLLNPYIVPALRELDGRDSRVVDYIAKDERFIPLVDLVCQTAKSRGKVTVACYGGRHRSVAVAETAAKKLNDQGFPTKVTHMDLRT